MEEELLHLARLLADLSILAVEHDTKAADPWAKQQTHSDLAELCRGAQDELRGRAKRSIPGRSGHPPTES